MSALGTGLVPYREQMNGLWNPGDNTKQLIVQHTTESEGGNTGVVGFLERTRNGSYQTMVDFDGEEVRMVPDNRQAWGAMNQGNRRGLHTCAMGRAEWDRARWLREGKLLERTAMRYAEWNRSYGIPLVKISAAQAAAGTRGIVGHIDISAAFGESDHWDPGHNFPYDVVIARAKEINAGGGEDIDMTPEQAKQLADVHRELTQRYPSRSAHRKDDKPIDTLAGFALNIDGRVHEASIDIPKRLSDIEARLDRLESLLVGLPQKFADAVERKQ